MLRLEISELSRTLLRSTGTKQRKTVRDIQIKVARRAKDSGFVGPVRASLLLNAEFVMKKTSTNKQITVFAVCFDFILGV